MVEERKELLHLPRQQLLPKRVGTWDVLERVAEAALSERLKLMNEAEAHLRWEGRALLVPQLSPPLLALEVFGAEVELGA